MSIPIKIVLLVLVLAAGIYDLRVRRIPNWLNVSGLALGLGANILFVPHGLAISLTGLLCALAVYVPLYFIRGMGAGDVKLMAAVGAICGPGNWVGIFLATALVGGFASLVLIFAKRRWRETSSNLVTIVGALSQRRVPTNVDPGLDLRYSKGLRMPHGAFIASGSMLFLIVSRLA
jgi:prepilin peptidase CpaA